MAKSRHHEDESVDVSAVTKTTRKKKASAEADEPEFNIRGMLKETVRDVARRNDYLPTPLESMPAMSARVLALDYLFGGGIRPGWYTSSGEEQTCKTTTQLSVLGAAIYDDVMEISHADFEGSTVNSRKYVSNIVSNINDRNITTQQLFGTQDQKTGEWVVPPMIRCTMKPVAEDWFDFATALLLSLPAKRMARGRWWYVFEKTKENQAKYGKYASRGMEDLHGKGIWVPCPEKDAGKLQAILFLDSYPAMCPRASAGEEKSNQLGQLASVMAAHMPRVKGLLADRMVAVFGVNQMRANVNIRAGYGPPQKEAGGYAIRFFSDVRLMHTNRVTGYPLWGKVENVEGASTRIELEPSVIHRGKDVYRYVHIKQPKNKLSTPNRSAWVRVWVEDPLRNAHGFDPFFDTMQYLWYTGQVVGRGRESLKLNLHISREGEIFTSKVIPWLDFKLWVLGDEDERASIAEKYGCPVVELRELCFKQMLTGYADKLYYAMSVGGLSDEMNEVFGHEDDDVGEAI